MMVVKSILVFSDSVVPVMATTDTYYTIVVRVDHDGRAAPEVDILLPPVSNVVGRPPAL